MVTVSLVCLRWPLVGMGILRLKCYPRQLLQLQELCLNFYVLDSAKLYTQNWDPASIVTSAKHTRVTSRTLVSIPRALLPVLSGLRSRRISMGLLIILVCLV